MATRRIDPNHRKKVISMMDEAVDPTKTDATAYATTLDLKHVGFIEGMHPTFFLLAPISPLQELEINEAHQKIIPPSLDKDNKPVRAQIKFERQGEMSLKYFKHCVKGLEEDGKEVPFKEEEFSLGIMQEIGSYAMLYSRVGEKLKKT